MNSQTLLQSADDPAHAPPVQVMETAESDDNRRVAPRIVGLSGVLQTTLEINELIALFARELAEHLSFDGLSYHFSILKIDIHLGSECGNSCKYELMVAGERLGDIILFRHTHFSDAELVTMENFLSSLLYPLRNTLLYQQALQSAIMDPVTGVRNRVAMESAVKREIEVAKRQQVPLSFILFDLDHFKLINDRYGHLYGDQALRAVAKCAEETIRDSDMLFRYGGEEFLVLLSGTALAGATLLAERIRTNIERMKTIPDQDVHMTVSLGVVTLRDGEDAVNLFRRADEALYYAKGSGRNRTVSEQELSE